MDKNQLPDPSLFGHHQDVQLRFNDIDILGHLNNTVYLSLYDLAKARYLEAVRKGNVNWHAPECVIANVNCSYLEQIRFNDPVEILTRCLSIGHKSFTIEQMFIDTTTGHIKSLCRTVMVCYDPETGKTGAVPDDLRKAFKEMEGHPIPSSAK